MGDETAKGLDLCERYFRAHGLPLLEGRFPDRMDRIAAGLVGDGSECFGFDDEVSRDHDWGPGFCLWISRGDVPGLLRPLEEALEALPGTFEGFGPRRVSRWGEGRVGVFTVEDFYRGFTGLDRPPETLDEWLLIPENALAAVTNGRVFRDGPGFFSQWRKILVAFYPEDVRKKKIASRCMTIAQSGQYNFGRSARRGEPVAAQYAETKFIADAISMVYLLNRRYAPFYKWMHRGLPSLSVLGERAFDMALSLVREADYERKETIISRFCGFLIEELKSQGLSRETSDFLADHGPAVAAGIEDPALRSRNVWVG